MKVPDVRHLSVEEEIHEHLGRHQLRARIHKEYLPELKERRVVFQSPGPDEEADFGSEVIIVLLTPPEHRTAEKEEHEEHRTPKRR